MRKNSTYGYYMGHLEGFSNPDVERIIKKVEAEWSACSNDVAEKYEHLSDEEYENKKEGEMKVAGCYLEYPSPDMVIQHHPQYILKHRRIKNLGKAYGTMCDSWEVTVEHSRMEKLKNLLQIL